MMDCRKICIQWMILYLLLATPGSQVVLCWGEDNHHSVETLSGDITHLHSSAQRGDSTKTFNFLHPDCPASSCIDIPLSLCADPEPATLTIQPIGKYGFPPIVLGMDFQSIHRAPQFVSQPCMTADKKIPLAAIRSVCLLN